MNVPIRMLGIATTIFWIILGTFIASAAYSLKDLNFGVGDPQFVTKPSQDLVIILPIFVDNNGFYDLKNLSLTTFLLTPEGTEMTRASSTMETIPAGRNTSILHNVALNLSNMAEKSTHYLFDDVDFTCRVIIGLNFAEIVPIQLSTNFTCPWGAPLSKFALGKPSLNTVNPNLATINVPISFVNHGPFDFSGNIFVRFFNEQGVMLAESQASVNVTKNESYSNSLSLPIPASFASSRNLGGHFEVLFYTSLFNYGPLVIPYD